MPRLELKVPPDLVAIVVAAMMWLVSRVTPSLDVPSAYRVPVAVVLLASAVAFIGAARVELAKAGTTFSPIAPDRSTRLVTGGVYRLTRNPMYLGTLLALLALAVLLSNPYSAVVAALFVAYMNRFQIVPEERVLSARFGAAYEEYASDVRRWL